MTIVGFAVAPTAPYETAYSSSGTEQESFQTSVGVVAIVRPSGESASGRLVDRLIVSVALPTAPHLHRIDTGSPPRYGPIRSLRVIDYAGPLGGALSVTPAVVHDTPTRRDTISAAHGKRGPVEEDR
jgi:hypothetical protein